MPCYSPLSAYRSSVSGEIFFHEVRDSAVLLLPCGRCIGCKLEYSRQWAVRIMHESQMHKVNCCVTLTYRDEDLPVGGSLCYRDFQLFMYRLRFHLKRKLGGDARVRFYMCGEYGDESARPHYHAVLFGVDFDDKVPWDDRQFTSKFLDSLWKLGDCKIQTLSFEMAAYIARYVTDKVTGPLAVEHYRVIDPGTGEIHDLVPEFSQMSRKPGIGAAWLDKYHSEVYALDADGYVRIDSVLSRGHEAKPPRYYDKRFKEMYDGSVFTEVFADRELSAWKRRSDNTASRLQVKKAVATARTLIYKRNKI